MFVNINYKMLLIFWISHYMEKKIRVSFQIEIEDNKYLKI